MLESLEQSNIKRMSVENPEKQEELWFDPEKELTPTDKEGIRQRLQSCSNNNHWRDFANLAARMKELGIPYQLTDTDKEGIQQKFQSFGDINWSFANLATRMKELEIPYQLKDTDKEGIQQEFQLYRAHNDWEYFTSLATSMKELEIPYQLTDTDKEGIQQMLQSSRNPNRRDFANLVAKMKELGIPYQLTDTDKDGIQQMLESFRNSNEWWNFAYLAANMKRLSDAEKPSTKLSDQPQLPEQRNF